MAPRGRQVAVPHGRYDTMPHAFAPEVGKVEKSSSAASVPGSSGACGGTKIFGSAGLRARGWVGGGAGFGAGCGLARRRCRALAERRVRRFQDFGGFAVPFGGRQRDLGTGAGGAGCVRVMTGATGAVRRGLQVVESRGGSTVAGDAWTAVAPAPLPSVPPRRTPAQ